MLRHLAILTCCILLVSAAYPAVSAETTAQYDHVSALDLISGKPQQLPIKGMVTMVDLGAHSCIPCKMMTPIIEALSKEYEGRAVIAFIDVWEHREEGSKYGISSIPTQIFYDASGKEQYRHVGFMDKNSIVAKLSELGVK
ncbi:thioredoxin family protein [Maridesulfovibrio sp. FT414]|uniref:thioredoxin family protein n=1 Tax=Maridesulfovibrio sp. FT414 TaxID=2979469 RepID=UPI003D8067F7